MPHPPAPRSRAEIREVDRRAVADFAIPGILLMENAARAVTTAVLALLPTDPGRPPRVAIVCGVGNNGGDGFAIARQLAAQGVAATAVLVGDRSTVRGDAALNLGILDRLGRPPLPFAADRCADLLAEADVVVDALLGTGLSRPAEGDAARAIALMNGVAVPVVAVDLPSGMDADTGLAIGPAVRATVTVTFVAPKPGFASAAAADLLGRVIVADIGVSPAMLGMG